MPTNKQMQDEVEYRTAKYLLRRMLKEEVVRTEEYSDSLPADHMVIVKRLCCEKPITSYSSKNRKYCSRECFLKRRTSHALKRTGNA